MSDLLTARHGADALRMALLPLSLVGFWAAAHFWMCSTRLEAGLARAGNRSGFLVPTGRD